MEVVTITPGKRLARALHDSHRNAQMGAGKTAWVTPVILPWGAWIESLLDDYVATGKVHSVPLAPNQALRLWGDVVRGDILVGAPGVALLAMQAWNRMHEWLIDPIEDWDALELSPDSERFASWAKAYEELLAELGWIDRALWQRQLPDLIREGEVVVPDQVRLQGFVEVMSDGQRAIVSALKDVGVTVTESGAGRSPTRPIITAATDRDDEIDRAAAWARARLESGERRIGIVVPDLAARVGEVDRALRRWLRPDLAQLVDGAPMAPLHIALGEPFAKFPIVAHALDWLALSPAGLSKSAVSDLLRSPFVGGWRLEQFARADLDLAVRRLPGDRVSLARVLEVADRRKIDAPMLIDYLSAWGAHLDNDAHPSKTPSGWVRQFSAELESLGHGTGRTLSSDEYQSWEAWQDTLDELSGMDVVTGEVPRDQALGLLCSLADMRSFRPQNHGCPIEVMTVTEALGGEYDALWVTGMDDSRWPPPAQPDPLLPRSRQQHCPDSTAAGQLERARLLLAGLFQTSARVVVSHAAVDGELPMSVTGILDRHQSVDIDEVVTLDPLEWPASAQMERVEHDDFAPALTDHRAGGGTGTLYLQSACPFRAMAEQRLGAKPPEPIRTGINFRDRGSMLHDALEFFWRQVRDSATLHAMSPSARAKLARECAGRAVDLILRENPLAIPQAMRPLEVERLSERLIDWLALELERPDFRVVAIEQEAVLQAGGLEFKVKLDRIDEIDSGQLLIDYKSGRAEPSGWLPGERMRAPQLPAYTLTLDEPPAGLAFGRLRPDQLGFTGLSRVATDIGGITPLARANRGAFRELNDWDTLLSSWRTSVDALAAGFQRGEAVVAPRDTSVCEGCPVRAICRLQDRIARAPSAPASPS